MTSRTVSALIFSLLFSASVFSYDKVVYGDDDRLDLFETSNALHLDLARSTAAMISYSKLSKSQNGRTLINSKTLSSRGICKTARFAKQVTAANCSGFLVGEDLLVTAGHCIKSQRDCDGSAWVFDFAVKTRGDETGYKSVPTTSVYKCSKIIERSLQRSTQDDYALIKLARVVEDRDPLKFRTEGKVQTGTKLVVIGHPTGLPTKIAAGAYVRDNKNKYYFGSNLDTFGGNSGSAVFDSETGQVEGILVRGEVDYVFDRRAGCRVPKVCTNEGCRGEDVTRITNIKKLMN